MKKNQLFPFFALLLLIGCTSEIRKEAAGFTQGTTYKVIYFNNGQDLHYQIDSLLLSFDRVLSTYQHNSYISKWNRNEQTNLKQPTLFKQQLHLAININELTQGAFDITVSPLMKYWFENNWQSNAIDSLAVDSITKNVGMHYLNLKGENYVKTNPNVQLDVNAIAQGFSVDMLARYLENKGVYNYLIEIGGEVRGNGTKENDAPWKIGIDQPSGDGNPDRKLELTVELNNRSLATSGNYRKYVEIDGQKFGHSLDPATGYPAKTDVLSATVLANDCATADALATACMVMGLQRFKEFLHENSEFDAVLIYTDSLGVQVWQSADE